MMFSPDTAEIREAYVDANFDQYPDQMRDLFYGWLADVWQQAYNSGKTVGESAGDDEENPYK